jgi:hypothetical protein
MKNWRQNTVYGIIAIISLTFAFIACDDGNGKNELKTFTITFDADNGTENTIQTVAEGSKATKPDDPTKDDYNFVYWFNIETDSEWNFDTKITTNITLKAKWLIDGMTKEKAIPLSFNSWGNGNANQWFSFTATEETQYIHIECETAFYPMFDLYDNDDNKIGSAGQLYGGGWVTRTLIVGQLYYINMFQIFSKETYKIAFNDSSSPPAIIIPSNDIIQITANTWTDGKTTDTKLEQWFRFTATVETQYIHCKAGQNSYAYIRLYGHNGIAISYPVEAYNGIRSFSREVTSGQIYYIRVYSDIALDEDYNPNTYQIAFNTTTVPPAIQLPTTSITELVLNTWVVPESSINGEIWFNFTATANTQYIHINIGSVTCYVQLYDNGGNALGDQIYVRESSANYIPQTVTIGQVYYLKGTTSSTAFQLGLTESDIPPKIQLPNENVVPLDIDTWKDGYIDNQNDEQWFNFTATATSQYVHFSFGTLRDLTLRVYDNSGKMVYTYQQGSSYRVYSYSDAYKQITLSIGQEYYLRIRQYGPGNTFKIAFNEIYTPPSE